MTKARYLEEFSAEASERLAIWGDNLRVARKSRGWSIEEASRRFRMAKGTLVQVEKGDPGVGVGAYIAAMDVMNLLDGVESMAASYRDREARSLRK